MEIPMRSNPTMFKTIPSWKWKNTTSNDFSNIVKTSIIQIYHNLIAFSPVTILKNVFNKIENRFNLTQVPTGSKGSLAHLSA